MTDLPALARVDAEFYADLWERLRHAQLGPERASIRGADAGQRRHGAPLRPRRSGRDLRAGVPGPGPQCRSDEHGRPQSTEAAVSALHGVSRRRNLPPDPPAPVRRGPTAAHRFGRRRRAHSRGRTAPGAASATRLRNGCGSARVRSPRSSPPVTFRRMTASGATEKPHCATAAGSSSSEERNSPASRANASTISRGFRVPTSPRVLRSSSPNAPRRAASSTESTSGRWRYTCPPSQTCAASCSTSCARSLPSSSLTRRHHGSRRLRCNACWPGRGRATSPS